MTSPTLPRPVQTRARPASTEELRSSFQPEADRPESLVLATALLWLMPAASFVAAVLGVGS